ncbi:Acyl transferase/acyl hydrolase/lysophospholipase [Nannochloropsis gaditana]|uniref:Acyl transferase/acyl hydrolase/lysophospholipase n=1 Tax=Nannochloropsis gaditana TaxID=72520 RepID=W7TRM8_9STRA|nr:Acyl transferase/acyl hydrolase/lysophospholipase [Nannochloropsis gaditana]
MHARLTPTQTESHSMKGDGAPNSRIRGWHQQRRRRITMMGQVFVGLCLGAVGAETTYPCRGSRSSYSFCACSAAFIPSHYEGCGSLSWEWERKGRHHQTTRYGHIKRAESFPEGGEQLRHLSPLFAPPRPGTQGLWALRRRTSEQEEADVDSENRRRKSVPVTSLEQLHQVLSPEGGLRLRDLDVRGDSTAALLSSSFPPSPSPSSSPSFHPVAAAIHARIASRSTPGARTDGLKIGLSLEGGGMRGCVGAGMLAALNHLGLRDAFDVVYGSSAGSLMGAYFLSGQTPLEGPGIYYDILSQAGRKFIDQAPIP